LGLPKVGEEKKGTFRGRKLEKEKTPTPVLEGITNLTESKKKRTRKAERPEGGKVGDQTSARTHQGGIFGRRGTWAEKQ